MNEAAREFASLAHVPPDIRRGDVVTLKTDRSKLPFVVRGQMYDTPATYLVRHLSAVERIEMLVARCEIATVERPAPLTIGGAEVLPERIASGPTINLKAGEVEIRPNGMVYLKPVIEWGEPNDLGEIRSRCLRFAVVRWDGLAELGAWVGEDYGTGDSSPPAGRKEVAKGWCEERAAGFPQTPAAPEDPNDPRTLSSIEWEPEDSRGEFRGHRGRFTVTPVNGKWVAADWPECQISLPLALPADAIEWCERQLMPPTREEVIDLADVEEEPEPTVILAAEDLPEALPVLEWVTHPTGQLKSTCGRFLITPKREPCGHLAEGVYFAGDQRVKGCFPNSGRYSPDGSLDECKSWCEERACEPVAGNQTPRGEDDGIPF